VICVVFVGAAFPLGYGALVGAAATAAVLGLLRLYARLFPPQRSSRFVTVFRSQRVSHFCPHIFFDGEFNPVDSRIGLAEDYYYFFETSSSEFR